MRILLACNAGMSTSMIVASIEEYISDLEDEIWAVDVDDVENQIGKFDVLLLAPQIQYFLKRMKKLLGEDFPVDVINSVSYGNCNGKEVLEQAYNLYSQKIL